MLQALRSCRVKGLACVAGSLWTETVKKGQLANGRPMPPSDSEHFKKPLLHSSHLVKTKLPLFHDDCEGRACLFSHIILSVSDIRSQA